MVSPTHRRFLWSGLAVFSLLIFLAIFNIVFTLQYDLIPSVQSSLFFSKTIVPSPGLHFPSSYTTGWLILIACLGFVTPVLELLTWAPTPKWLLHRLPANAGGKSASMARRCKAAALPAVTSCGNLKGALNDADAESGNACKPPASRRPKTWAQRCVPAWILHLSPAALVFLFVWQGVIVTSWLVPYGYKWLYLSNPDNMGLVKQFSKYNNVSRSVIVVHALGRTAGWPCAVSMAMVLVPVDRSSAWLAALNMSHEEANIFHRIFGWGAFFWMVLHSTFQHSAWLCVNFAAWRDELLPPPHGWYNAHTDRFVASVGGFMAVLLFFSSLTWVRQYCYNFFRVMHLSVWIMLPLLIMHEYFSFYFMCYGFLLYCADLAQRWVINASNVPATLSVACDNVTQVMIRMTRKHMRPDASWASKVVYLRVNRVSFWETHPFSVSSVDGDIVTLHVGVAGNWTGKLFELAQSGGADGVEVPVHVEGPYGADLSNEVVETDTVVLLAGGMGITPMASMLQQLLDLVASSAAGRLTQVHLVWVVRQAAMAKMIPFSIIERAAATAGFNVKLFVTQTPMGEFEADEKAPAVANPAHVALPVQAPAISRPSLSGEGEPASPFQLFLRRFAVRTILTWVATATIIAGYIISLQIVYITKNNLAAGSPHLLAVQQQYTDRVLDAYKHSRGYNASAAWPKAQPTWAVFSKGLTEQVIFGATITCVGCAITGTMPSMFPYGMGGYSCCTDAVPIVATFIWTLFPILFCLVFTSCTALACKHVLAKRWPLHTPAAAQTVSLEMASARRSSHSDDESPASSSKDVKLYEAGGGTAVAAGLPLHPGRPLFDDELSAIAAGSVGRRMVVYCCGPCSMRAAVKRAVYKDADFGNCKVVLRDFHARD